MAEEKKRTDAASGQGSEENKDREGCKVSGPLGTCPTCRQAAGPVPPGAPSGQADEEPVDPMEAYLADLPEWARGPIMAYGKQAAAALVLLLLAVALWSGYTHYTASKEAEAAYALGQVFAIEEADQRISKLKDVINRFEGTDAADHARLLLAGQLLDDGKWDEAASAFKKAEASLDHALADSAIMGYGYAQEETGALDSALSSYSRAAESKNGFEAVATLDRARVLMKKGNREQALAAYDRYLDMRPQSPQLDFIRFQIQMLSTAETGAEETGRPGPGSDQKESAGAG